MSFDNTIYINNVKFLVGEGQGTIFFQNAEVDVKEVVRHIKKGYISLDMAVAISTHFNISLDRLVHRDITKKKTDIKFLVLDVDGVLTEGGMYYAQSGDEFKRFHTRDGMALKKLTKSGFQVAFLSSGINAKLVQSRADLLGVQRTYTGLDPKMGILTAWMKELSVEWDQIAYIGDDVNDVEVMKLAGFTACPSDATTKVKSIVDQVLEKRGGEGCVREFVEEFLMEI
jgi:3-deoxy-D-manno-octulosonate 8-phosphate phosphatase (KDO 8-P phosphatase)